MKSPNYRFIKNIVSIALTFFVFNQITNARELPDFTKLVDEHADAIVNISTVAKQEGRSGRLPHGFNMPDVPENSPFFEFFEKFLEQMPEGGGAAPQPERSSLGSGFIISKDGYVITNHHVVMDAEEIMVRLSDRSEYVAELIGSDEKSDIAVLKIDATNLPHLKFGKTDDLKAGQWVLAIGSPFGLDYSVTAGIISAIGRSLPNENYVPFIQTDVAINPGNSGGPLFNLDGEVIGVNSQIYSRTGGFMGLSFSVPADVVQNVYKQILDKGQVTRGWLGVLIQDVTRELAESFDMKKPQGALISKVLPESPALKAGIEVGDIVIRFNGKEVSFSSDLPPMVGATAVGKKVPVDILRRGKEKRLTLTIEALPSEGKIASSQTTKQNTDKVSNKLGISVEDLTDDQREEIDIDDHGVLVSQVSAGPAQKAGIRQGDVLLLINNTKVKDTAHFSKLVEKLEADKSIPVLVQRRGGPIFLAIKLDKE